ncbi:MAG: endolytic transglycosylase MltG [Clostridiales bacterium]|nr:endolytic transglycosylase MltG [Clostridiales bacterium]
MSDPNQFETTSWNADEVRLQSEAPSERQHPRKKRKFNWLTYTAFVLIVSAILAGVGWLLANDLCALNKKPLTATITVDEGDSLGKIAKKLKKAGIIEYKGFFVLFGTIAHASAKIDPGIYDLNTDMDYRALISKMQTYTPDSGTVQVTVPEGYTVMDTINLLAEKEVASVDSLTEAAKNYVFSDYPFIDNENLNDISRLEGYLFPDTYEFYIGEQSTSALERMLDNFQTKMEGELTNAVNSSGYTMDQIITMASIIQKESIGDETENANIASVLYNRLQTDNHETVGYLQLDSTINYAMDLLNIPDEDFSTELDSPYNTYLYQGLPKGPICNPGLAAIQAAISPSSTDYYYFAYGKDGVSHFFRTYDEHLNFVNSSMYATAAELQK